MIRLYKTSIFTNCGEKVSAFQIIKNNQEVGVVEIDGYADPAIRLTSQLHLTELQELQQRIQETAMQIA